MFFMHFVTVVKLCHEKSDFSRASCGTQFHEKYEYICIHLRWESTTSSQCGKTRNLFSQEKKFVKSTLKWFFKKTRYFHVTFVKKVWE